MDKRALKNLIGDFLRNSGHNVISAEQAISGDMIGLRIFDEPLVGIASADAIPFKEMQKEFAVGPQFTLPEEWLPGASSVISFFLPFTERVRRANRTDRDDPAPEWLHGRIEGQACINLLSKFLVDSLRQAGYDALAPSLDGRFASCGATNIAFRDDDGKLLSVSFTSNWSERHVAYVCGLGSFGLSKGLITAKGMAGRFASVVTSLFLPPDNTIASSVYENCTLCGACAENCPVDAISIEKGKDHILCAEYLDAMKKKYRPRYGCGKCQTGVPCERGIPPKSE